MSFAKRCMGTAIRFTPYLPTIGCQTTSYQFVGRKAMDIVMPKNVIYINKKGEDGYKVISVRMKKTTLQKIDDLSAESNRSRNELINIILENSVDDVKINEA